MSVTVEHRLAKANRLITAIRTRALMAAFPHLLRLDREVPLIRIGTTYGGWWVPDSGFDSKAVCYSGGVGTDISFDLGLIRRFGCSVWGFDPTPAAAAYVLDHPKVEGFTFLPYGLAGHSGSRRFYAPRDPGHVSHSIANLQKTTEYFEAQCKTVAELMRELRHTRIDLLKLDIEGAQHEVIDSILADAVYPTVICVEFDQPEPFSRTRFTVSRLRDAGYALVKVDGFDLTFVA